MSLSATDRSQDHNISRTNYPVLHDWYETIEDREVFKERSTESENDSLVEHILDFLDKYPVCFVPQPPLSECSPIC